VRRIVPVGFLVLASCVASGPWPIWEKLTLPLRSDSVRFAVIGDSGTGGRLQQEVASRMAELHQRFPFTFVIMLGDNIYGGEEADDFERKFTRPYQALLAQGVEFYAVLGNHDLPPQRLFAPFHMGGRRYYTFMKGTAQFFALDSNYMDPQQLEWLAHELEASQAPWKICFFHHPLYSSGRRHGSEVDLRALVEPLFVRYGVNVVFSGHEHLYERMKPQHGVHYFTSGGAAKLSRGDLGRGRKTETALRAVGFDQDREFMLIEIAGDALSFQAISRTGRTIDSGTITRASPHARAPGASRAERLALARRPLLREVG
jgi:3',5'-cyclic AMP phosphodiesterase CpdA